MENKVKIHFEFGEKINDSHSESLWAEEVSPNQYRLLNSPFYAKGVSFRDTVFAKRVDGELWFYKVKAHTGHSTYRIFVYPQKRDSFQEYWKPIEELGATFEQGIGTLYSVDLPPGVDVYKVYALLERGEKDGIWSFEEGHFAGN